MTLDKEAADGIEWSAPRLLCIAGAFMRYPKHTIGEINRNIELLRYRQFVEQLRLLDPVTGVTAFQVPAAASTSRTTRSSASQSTISEVLGKVSRPVRDLYDLIHDHLTGLVATPTSIGDTCCLRRARQATFTS